MDASTVVVGATDPGMSFLPQGTWNLTNADTVTLMQGGYPSQILYSFPSNASGFQWSGCKSGSGDAALLCFDCDCSSGSPGPSATVLSVNFSDFSLGNSLLPPTVLYETQLEWGRHNVCISNAFERMEQVAGQEEGVWGWIFHYEFRVNVTDPGAGTGTSTATTSTTSTVTGTPTNTLPPASAPATPDPTPSPAPTGAITGGVIGGLAFLLVASLTMIYYFGHYCNIHLPFLPAYRGPVRRARLALDDESPPGTPPTGSGWSASTPGSERQILPLNAVPGRGLQSHSRMLSDEGRSPSLSPAISQAASPRRPYPHSPSPSRSSIAQTEGGAPSSEESETGRASGSSDIRSRVTTEPPSYDEVLGMEPARTGKR
ncbi:hypothetical protein DACRYDRAFT_109223 [Dacryopinax primogenitus]|uniref:Uncharacterized protein n=1 Tax=Dacryopinax primogenitus (strain DJM 731) TaxID=1858805 RepID=M5G7P4_DACPD|nr:uncharacterized protein DACRYDRAFT_109223 [Dacryopinax primogenitus]EJT99797.1 hypothetical protein DACRYDRAFT_109223 [Dacryopinax primogenitus]